MKKLTLLLVLTLLSACNPKKNSVKANVATISGVTVGTQCVGQTGSQFGTIYDSNMSMDFENRVRALLSATMLPSEVGSVSPNQADQTGVRFSGIVKLDANGVVVGTQSRILISVYDSIWLMNRYTNPNEQEIKIDFDPNAGKNVQISGQFNVSTGDGYLSIRDNYGEVRFEGRIDAQRFSGNVTFANTQNVAGGAPASGNLGQFYIQRCSFLQ